MVSDDIFRKGKGQGPFLVPPRTVPPPADARDDFVVLDAHRAAVRALCLDLEPDFTTESLRQGYQKLAQVAAIHQLQVLEPPLFTLDAHPLTQRPKQWAWRLVQPVRGLSPVQHDEVTVTRTHGGMYLQTVTQQGLADLGDLYAFVLGQYLPSIKHEPTRNCIYHRVLDGLESDSPSSITIRVFVPIILSIEPVTNDAA